MRTIPLLDLRAQYHSIKPELDAAIQRVFDSGQFILGPEVEAFEREVAAYCGVAHAVGVASGTDALELSLRACGIGPGDEVVTTAYSFFATAEAIIAVGATPVFADIELETYNIDPDDLAARLTSRTKAVIPVHLYGHPCAIERILAMAHAHRLTIIEDCAQAIGARWGARRVGSFGAAGALSFFPSKNLGGYGDGGMVVTNDAAVADQVRLLRTHGSREKYWHTCLGTNSRLDELQAAMLRVKLRHLDAWIEGRRRCAQAYVEQFRRQAAPAIILPKEMEGYTHVYHQFSIRLNQRDRIKQALRQEGIGSQVYYPSTLPAQPALTSYIHNASCGRAEEVCRDILSLPIYPELPNEDIRRIVETVVSNLP